MFFRFVKTTFPIGRGFLGFLGFLIFLGFLGFLGEDLGILAVRIKLEKEVPTIDLGVLTKVQDFREGGVGVKVMQTIFLFGLLVTVLECLDTREEQTCINIVETQYRYK